MARGRKQKKPYRRRRGLRLLYLLLSFILIVGAIISSCLFFFRLESIEVRGNTRYSQEQILLVADIRPNSNLFLLPRKLIANRVTDSMPYVKRVHLKNQFPSTLIVDIEECTPLACFRSETTFWIIDAQGKILEQVQEGLTGEYIHVDGISLLTPTVAQQAEVAPEAEGKLAALCALLNGLEKQGLAQNVDWIDLGQDTAIEMNYQERFTVRFPLHTESSATETGSETYSLKIEALGKIIEKLDESDHGIIDLWEDKGFFRPR